MNRNRDTGTTLPSDLNFTLAHFFTEEQNQTIERNTADIAALSARLIDNLVVFGKKAEAWMAGHPLEAKGQRMLLEPLKQESALLAQLLHRVQARMRAVMPAQTLEQLEAALHLQLQDVGAGQRHGSPEQDTAALAEAEQMAGSAYAAVAASNAAIAFALDAARYRKTHLGHLAAAEVSAVESMQVARKKNDAAITAIQAWRYAQAQRERPEV